MAFPHERTKYHLKITELMHVNLTFKKVQFLSQYSARCTMWNQNIDYIYDIFFQYPVSSTVMDFVAVVFILALLCFFFF